MDQSINPRPVENPEDAILALDALRNAQADLFAGCAALKRWHRLELLHDRQTVDRHMLSAVSHIGMATLYLVSAYGVDVDQMVSDQGARADELIADLIGSYFPELAQPRAAEAA